MAAGLVSEHTTEARGQGIESLVGIFSVGRRERAAAGDAGALCVGPAAAPRWAAGGRRRRGLKTGGAPCWAGGGRRRLGRGHGIVAPKLAFSRRSIGSKLVLLARLFDAAIRHGVCCKPSCIKEPKYSPAVLTEARTAAGTQW